MCVCQSPVNVSELTSVLLLREQRVRHRISGMNILRSALRGNSGTPAVFDTLARAVASAVEDIGDRHSEAFAAPTDRGGGTSGNTAPRAPSPEPLLTVSQLQSQRGLSATEARLEHTRMRMQRRRQRIQEAVESKAADVEADSKTTDDNGGGDRIECVALTRWSGRVHQRCESHARGELGSPPPRSHGSRVAHPVRVYGAGTTSTTWRRATPSF